MKHAFLSVILLALVACGDTRTEVERARECYEAALAVRNTQSQMQSYPGETGVKAYQQALNWAEKACGKPYGIL